MKITKKIMIWSRRSFLVSLVFFLIVTSLMFITNATLNSLIDRLFAVSILLLSVSFIAFSFLEIKFNHKKMFSFLKSLFYKTNKVYRSKKFGKVTSFTVSLLVVLVTVIFKIIKLIIDNSSSSSSVFSDIYTDEDYDYNVYNSIYSVNTQFSDDFKIGDKADNTEYSAPFKLGNND